MKFEKSTNSHKCMEITNSDKSLHDSNLPPFRYVINNKNLDNIVLETLEIDRSFRYVGVEDDLFTTDQLNKKPFDYIYPTIQSQFNNILNKKYTLNKSQILRNLYNNYPIIRGMNMDNILIAGGAICNAITNTPKRDLDIFIYGVDEYGANQTTFRILDHLSKFELDGKCKFKFIKTANALTIEIDQENNSYYGNYSYYRRIFTIQIIFRLYKTKSEILHSFDIGSACIGFDGIDILFTTLSKFSYEYNCNIVDNTRRSTTYEKRLLKYFKRGFKIIMPNFDINILTLHKKCIILPKIFIDSFTNQGNIISADMFKIHILDNNAGSDYDTIDFELLNKSIDSVLNTKLDINWIKQDPSKMLSSSYNPIEDTEFTWYGMYLLKKKSPIGGLWKRLKGLF